MPFIEGTPFSFIVLGWLLGVVIGLGLYFLKRYRILSRYVISISTGGMIGTLVASTFVLWVGLMLFSDAPHGGVYIVIGMYFIAMIVGGLAGAVAGFLAARRMNQRTTKHDKNTANF